MKVHECDGHGKVDRVLVKSMSKRDGWRKISGANSPSSVRSPFLDCLGVLIFVSKNRTLSY